MGPAKRAPVSANGETDVVADLGWPDWIDPTAAGRLREGDPERKDRARVSAFWTKGGRQGSAARAFAQALCCTNEERRTDRLHAASAERVGMSSGGSTLTSRHSA